MEEQEGKNIGRAPVVSMAMVAPCACAESTRQQFPSRRKKQYTQPPVKNAMPYGATEDIHVSIGCAASPSIKARPLTKVAISSRITML